MNGARARQGNFAKDPEKKRKKTESFCSRWSLVTPRLAL
jgi:hypothetical protein